MNIEEHQRTLKKIGENWRTLENIEEHHFEKTLPLTSNICLFFDQKKGQAQL